VWDEGHFDVVSEQQDRHFSGNAKSGQTTAIEVKVVSARDKVSAAWLPRMITD
jgi:hypothetical protein